MPRDAVQSSPGKGRLNLALKMNRIKNHPPLPQTDGLGKRLTVYASATHAESDRISPVSGLSMGAFTLTSPVSGRGHFCAALARFCLAGGFWRSIGFSSLNVDSLDRHGRRKNAFCDVRMRWEMTNISSLTQRYPQCHAWGKAGRLANFWAGRSLHRGAN